MKPISQYLIKERNFVFNGNLEEFSELLKKAKYFSYSKEHLEQLVFYAEISAGTLIIQGGVNLIDGIKVDANLQEIDSSKIRVQLNTSVRIEHYIFVAFFIFCLLGCLYLKQIETWKLLFVPVIWVLVHLWFRTVYQLQEEALIENIVSQLNLQKEVNS